MISSEKDRSDWVIRKFNSHEAMRRQQIRDWQKLTGAERRSAAWELVLDYWAGRGRSPDELGLQRTTTSIQRAGG